ncbi:uncharacterized protein LOC141528576 isoform X2 [Cotesia typhae]
MNLLIIAVMIIGSTAEIKNPVSRSESMKINEDLTTGTIKTTTETVINGADGSQEIQTISRIDYNNSRKVKYSELDDLRSYTKDRELNHTLSWESNVFKDYRLIQEFEKYTADDSSVFIRDVNRLYNDTGVYTSISKTSIPNNGVNSTNYVRQNEINGTVYVIKNTTVYGDGSTVDHLDPKNN